MTVGELIEELKKQDADEEVGVVIHGLDEGVEVDCVDSSLIYLKEMETPHDSQKSAALKCLEDAQQFLEQAVGYLKG